MPICSAATKSLLSTISPPALSKTSDTLKTIHDFTTRSTRVHNQPVTAELVDQCDVIFHLAAAVGVKLIVESPVRTIETNVRGTEVVLALANKKKKKVLIASTSEVYGLSADVPFREDGNLVMGATTKGRWSYACSKAIDEFLALAYWREKKLPTTIVQTLQYGRPTTDRAVRHGDPDVREAGARRSPDHGLRQTANSRVALAMWATSSARWSS